MGLLRVLLQGEKSSFFSDCALGDCSLCIIVWRPVQGMRGSWEAWIKQVIAGKKCKALGIRCCKLTFQFCHRLAANPGGKPVLSVCFSSQPQNEGEVNTRHIFRRQQVLRNYEVSTTSLVSFALSFFFFFCNYFLISSLVWAEFWPRESDTASLHVGLIFITVCNDCSKSPCFYMWMDRETSALLYWLK